MNKIKQLLVRIMRSIWWGRTKIRPPYILPHRYKQRLKRYEKIGNNSFGTDGESDLAFLRMYAHILDKPLHRVDWAPGHSADFYRDVKKLLADYGQSNDPTVLWARDIVREYEARHMVPPGTVFPLGEPVGPPPLGPEKLLEQMCYRTSIRHYKNRPVDQALVERITEAALEAPWSCSRQALHIYASVTLETVGKALSCFKGFTHFSQFVPCVMVFCVDLRSYAMPNELFVPHFDAGLASSNAALMASSLGVSMVFLTWGSRTPDTEHRLRTLFKIPDYYEITCGACCGFPAQKQHRPARKPIVETLIWK